MAPKNAIFQPVKKGNARSTSEGSTKVSIYLTIEAIG